LVIGKSDLELVANYQLPITNHCSLVTAQRAPAVAGWRQKFTELHLNPSY